VLDVTPLSLFAWDIDTIRLSALTSRKTGLGSAEA